jgi:hypothetical protein
LPLKTTKSWLIFALCNRPNWILSPENAKLILSGDVNDTDRYFTYLKDFFGEVTLNDTKVLVPCPVGLYPTKY